MVDIFDSNNLSAKYIQPGRQLNNYCVTDTPTMLDAMRRAVASWYFLPTIEADGPSVPLAQYQPVPAQSILTGTLRLSLFSQCYDPKAAVTITLDGAPISQDSTPGDHAIAVSPQNFDLRQAHCQDQCRRLKRSHSRMPRGGIPLCPPISTGR